jgi:hypothetical protein
MTPELQVENKELGCECDIFLKCIFEKKLARSIGFGLFTEAVHQIMI